MADTYWIGVDLGGTKILAGLFDEQFRLLARVKQSTTPEQGAEAVVARIVQTVDKVIAEAKVEPSAVRGMGLGTPGQIDPQTRLVRYAPNLGWRDFDLLAALPTRWQWKTIIENDVRMGTYGEFAYGAAQGAKNVLGIFVGTGVGGGLILNGELYHGFNGNAGEIGHTVVHYRKGLTLEAVAGRKSMMAQVATRLSDAPKRVRKEWKNVDLSAVKSSQLADFYQDDDPIAVEVIDDAARALGAAVGGMVNFLSPEVVVIGGGVAGALGESFLERIWEVAQRYTLPRAAENVRCVAASLGDDSGLYGAAAYVRDQCRNSA